MRDRTASPATKFVFGFVIVGAEEAEGEEEDEDDDEEEDEEASGMRVLYAGSLKAKHSWLNCSGEGKREDTYTSR
jgi:hypothetical protein